ncbi:hypothetical protein GCM10019016_015960 [Streptomyces prasinosporus]|uniref:Inositolphosphotransferase Aur1/Ipt1 domain-containing protein n=1 Tax=Streptomyces prasinosporus TaxID=68256 RepID=A0ABP6TGY4_9ACTN
MNYYYATLHFVVTLGVLVWLYRRHPGRYAATRLVLFVTTGFALVGYYLYPLAPPRLMHGQNFVDTVLVHQTWGSMASGDLKNVSNQYAAMPSMHIGWSLWCGLTLFALATCPWARVLGLLYPAAHPGGDRRHRQPLLAGRGRAACCASPSATGSPTPGTAAAPPPCPRHVPDVGTRRPEPARAPERVPLQKQG